MSTYQPDRLLQLWKLEQIDNQMVIGHLLQNLVTQAETLTKLTTACTRLRLDLDRLTQQMSTPSAANRKKDEA